MQRNTDEYEVAPFPLMRRMIVDLGRFAHRKHNIRGLLETDVTRARRFIREHKEKTGESLSFTAFVISCVGRAVEENKFVHAYRNWKNQLVIFNDVDVLTYIESSWTAASFRLRISSVPRTAKPGGRFTKSFSIRILFL